MLVKKCKNVALMTKVWWAEYSLLRDVTSSSSLFPLCYTSLMFHSTSMDRLLRTRTEICDNVLAFQFRLSLYVYYACCTC